MNILDAAAQRLPDAIGVHRIHAALTVRFFDHEGVSGSGCLLGHLFCLAFFSRFAVAFAPAGGVRASRAFIVGSSLSGMESAPPICGYFFPK